MRPVPDQLPTERGDKKSSPDRHLMRHKVLSPSRFQSHGLLRFPKVTPIKDAETKGNALPQICYKILLLHPSQVR